MRYIALACDYDGTIAHHGRVDEATIAALERTRASGRKLILVTGRELEDLLANFPRIDLFERMVLENGGLLFRPATREERVLGAAPPPPLIEALRQRGVAPLSVGRSILATWEPHEKKALEAIRDLGLEWSVIFNKGAVMLLPPGVNKATGLAAALQELGLSPHNVVGVGDAENDHAFLQLCECSAAVSNALPLVKEQADVRTRKDHGAGVIELIDELLADDLAEREGQLVRHHLLLGTRPDGQEVRVRPFGTNLLLAGPSASGKSTAATSFMERLAEHHYQFCVIDPEGDYGGFKEAMVLGESQRPPTVKEVLRLLQDPAQNVVVSLVGLPLAERPGFFLSLLPALQEARARTCRPHWLVVDEAHHLLPASWRPAEQTLPRDLDRVLLITVHPREVSSAILARVDTAIAVGQKPEATFRQFAEAVERPPPDGPLPALNPGEVLFWEVAGRTAPVHVRVAPGKTERYRHRRKYAEGQLPPERSFFFRGPEGKLNLRAQNLVLFLQIAQGVDEATWRHHLQQGDYSRWFREEVKDDALAEEVAQVEEQKGLSASESLARVRAAIEQRYTLPAESPVQDAPAS